MTSAVTAPDTNTTGRSRSSVASSPDTSSSGIARTTRDSRQIDLVWRPQVDQGRATIQQERPGHRRCQQRLVDHARPYICPPAWRSRTNPRPALGRLAWSTHGLFTGDQWRALLTGGVQGPWITDAVLSRRRPAQAQIVPVAPLLAHVLGSRD